MKIAVYGDSFVEMMAPKQTDQPTWISMLVQDLGATHVDWYGQGGSSTYFSYQKILDTADQYDRIIWAVTEPVRYPVRVPRIQPNPHLGWISTPDIVGYADPDIRSALEGWYKMNDPDFMKTVQQLMIQEVLKLYPTTVLIPCFSQSLPRAVRKSTGWGEWCLQDICHMFTQHYFGRNRIRTLTEPMSEQHNMVHHMPIDWHEIVADYVYQVVTGNGRLWTLRINQMPALKYPLNTYMEYDQS